MHPENLLHGLVREEIPIKSFSIAAFVCRDRGDIHEYLLLRRSSKELEGTWQMVSGKVEQGEFGWQAALREIKEETGLVPREFYSADSVEVFYNHRQNCINLIPVFLARVDETASVKLNPTEHSEYEWLPLDIAVNRLTFAIQRENLRRIDDQFWSGTPYEYLRIEGEV